MKKYILIALMLCGVAYGQTPNFTPMRSYYEFKGIKIDSLFLLPYFADTTAANLSMVKNIEGSLIRADGKVYYRSTGVNEWVEILDAPYYESDIQVMVADYNIKRWGVYYFTNQNAGMYDINFPNPALFGGRYIVVVNESPGQIYFGTGFRPFDFSSGNYLSNLGNHDWFICYSDGVNWLVNPY